MEENPAYNTSLRLLNHTDQVSYGGPGFLLAFHCVAGEAGGSSNATTQPTLCPKV